MVTTMSGMLHSQSVLHGASWTRIISKPQGVFDHHPVSPRSLFLVEKSPRAVESLRQ